MTERWYFAYGANMSPAVFEERRGMCPQCSEAARLDGFRLAFDLPGIPLLEPAFANIHPDPGECVHGALYKVTSDELEMLDRLEACGDAYEAFDLPIEGRLSGRVTAHTYRSLRVVRGLRPSRRYLELMRDGARTFDLPEAWQRRLAEQPVFDSPLARRFQPFVIRAFEAMMRRGWRPTVAINRFWDVVARFQRLIE